MKTLLFLVLASVLLSGCGLRSIPLAESEVEAAWAEVMNQYKRRSDLVPQLVNTVKGYASHEKETFQAVTEARAKATQTKVTGAQLNAQSVAEVAQAQSALSSALSRLLLVVERYPNLKANQNFLDLQTQLEGTENRIGIARRRYIESVKKFNQLVTVPPTSWFNALFYKHEKKPQFSVENAEEVQKAPEVKF